MPFQEAESMKGHMKRIALAALASCAANFATAGVYVELVNHNLSTNKSELAQKMYVQGGMGRFVDGDGRATLIKQGTLYIIDDADKSYVVFDKATMESLARTLNEAMAKMKEQLAKMPPEQRAQMEEMLNKQMPGMAGDGKQWTVEVMDTGKSDNVDGRSCRLWDVTRNGQLDDQLCVVPYSALPGKENLQTVFAEFAKAFEEMAKSAPMLSGVMTNEFSAQAKVNGFPVRSRSYENGKLVNEEQLMKEWREETIPAAMFQVPTGYKRKTMEELAAQ
jgi:hypothetical protein